MRPAPALVFTDLDGTLLDHDDYRFDAAIPALRALRALQIPLILATSKTLSEVIEIQRALDNNGPVIVENGAALCLPERPDYPFDVTAHERIQGYAVLRFGPPYTRIRAFIDEQRAHHGYALRGFGDMSDREVASLTGLTHAQAALARQRLGSEPFDWRDSAAELERLRGAAAQQGMRITRGGRFWHLMGQTSKAEAMHRLCALYADDRDDPLTVIALGDSANDVEMLRDADIAVSIRRPDGGHIDCHGIRQTIQTEQPGPAGWNTALLRILNDLFPSQTRA